MGFKYYSRKNRKTFFETVAEASQDPGNLAVSITRNNFIHLYRASVRHFDLTQYRYCMPVFDALTNRMGIKFFTKTDVEENPELKDHIRGLYFWGDPPMGKVYVQGFLRQLGLGSEPFYSIPARWNAEEHILHFPHPRRPVGNPTD